MNKFLLRSNSIFGRLVLVMFVMAFIVVFLFISVYTIAVSPHLGSSAMIITHYAIVGCLFLLLVLTHIISYRIIKKLIQPIQQLKQAALEVAAGNFEVSVPATTKDELGELTHAFNHMSVEIREMIEARERMLRDISHELRTPLTRMKLALEMLQNEPLRESMREDVQELEALTREILEAEQWRKGILADRFTQVDLVTLLREVAAGFAEQPPGIVFKTLPLFQELQIDEKAVRKALKNVLENAVKYSRPDSRPIEISGGVENAGFALRIADDGIGIPPAELSKIFKPFYRVDAARTKDAGRKGGYGLGLNLAKNILEAHQGQLVLENNIQGGVTATFWFPLDKREPAKPPPSLRSE